MPHFGNTFRRQLDRQPWLWALALGDLYLATRLFHLDALPVFADESIYIRWAQLLRHDTAYLFFALNDGKPPLFIWMIAGMLSLVSQPLLAGRLLSVLVGLAQLAVSDQILKQFTTNREARIIQALIIIFAPFWFFHDRMALMDATLVLWLSVSWWGLLLLDRDLTDRTEPTWRNLGAGILLGGIGWGLALWTKTPALFFSLVIVGWAYLGRFSWWATWRERSTLKLLAYRTLAFAAVGLFGLSIFALLKLHPAFGSLFGRSDDFTFQVSEILAGEWRVSLDNLGRCLRWLSTYFRPELFSLPFIAALVSRRREWHWRILAGALIMALPFIVLGRTVHPRYYLPVAPFITASAALFVPEVWQRLRQPRQAEMQLVFWLLVLSFAIGSWRFMLLSYFTPDQTPFVLADRSQYLTEWSSGHGIQEVTAMMRQAVAGGKRLTVVTEGSFGTLPDALLMEFDARPEIRWLRIEGLAQYPVKTIPDWVWDEAADHQTWLVVNENRMEVNDKRLELMAQYPRPYGAPALQVYQLHAATTSAEVLP